MKSMKTILGIMMVCILLVSCKSDEPTINDYFLNYQIEEVPVNSDVIVGAYYYNLGTTFDPTRYTRITETNDNTGGKVGPYVRPLLSTPEAMYSIAVNKATSVPIIQQHVDWANQGGINYLVLPAIREDGTKLYPNNINAGDSTFVNFATGKVDSLAVINWGNLKYVVSMDINSMASDLNQNKLIETAGSTKIQGVSMTREQRLYNYFKRIAHYFKDDKYFHLNGRPVVILLSPEKLYSAKSDTIYNNIRDTVKAYCGKDIYIIARQNAWTPPARYNYFFMKGKVDAVSMDNMCNVGGAYYDRLYWLPQLINENFKYNRKYISSTYGIDFIPTVSPSHNYYVSNTSYNNPIVYKNTGEFKKYCNAAKMNLGNANMVLIESFNNWTNDAAIEPTDPSYGNGYGTTYLDILKKEFKRD
jgi:hypothetical protein